MVPVRPTEKKTHWRQNCCSQKASLLGKFLLINVTAILLARPACLKCESTVCIGVQHQQKLQLACILPVSLVLTYTV